MEHDTAGDPITGLKWTHKTTDKVAAELARFGIMVSSKTVGRLLKNLGFSLRVNHKTLESGNKNPPNPKDRDRQFRFIKRMRESFDESKNPIISIDSKKREMIGNFKNNGKSWESEVVNVNDHDFPSDAEGVAVIYGIYSTQTNRGNVYVGTSHDTAAFSADCITNWWKQVGRKSWPNANEILILADSGGSNSSRSRVWKNRIYHQLCKPFGITVRVCHYPPGTSKWNLIEHRLFAEISKNWAGEPLVSYEKIIKFIRTTKTKTGLRVAAKVIDKIYQTGEKVTNKEMNEILIKRHKLFPNWNYSICKE